MGRELFHTLLAHSRTTRGTFMFEEPGVDDSEKTIRNVYIRKAVVDGNAPLLIRVTVESVTDAELTEEELAPLVRILDSR